MPGGVLDFWAVIALDHGAAFHLNLLGDAACDQITVRVEQNEAFGTDLDRFQIAGCEHSVNRRTRDVGDLREL
jgi:hypothetical protein